MSSLVWRVTADGFWNPPSIDYFIDPSHFASPYPTAGFGSKTHNVTYLRRLFLYFAHIVPADVRVWVRG